MFLSKLLIKVCLVLITSSYTKSNYTKRCPFMYTVDLSNSILLPNGSYLYDNQTIIPPKYVSDYNYTILISDPKIKNVQSSKRGCICAVRQCLPFCSDKMEIFYENYKSECVDYGFGKNVTYSGGVVKRRHLMHDFHPIYGKVCDMENSYMLMPERELYNDWTLYEDSTLLRHYDRRNLTTTEYCFDVKIFNEEYQFLINPVVCGETVEIPWFKIWAMAFSIPFLIITIICYYTLTKPHVARSKCFITYLSLVSLSYTLICFYTITGVDFSSVSCKLFGFSVYYTIIGYLTWTCILSYDTWKSLTTLTGNHPTFTTYSYIGWLVPLALTFLTFWAQISNLPDEWKPGIENNMCAVNTLRWSALIYYYVPCIFVFAYCFVLYICIVVFKKQHSKALLTLFYQGPEPLLERFVLFFRIFFFMGISWALDIVSYFCRMAFGAEEYFVYLALDIFNAFHGFLVFLAFICRPSVWMRIKKIVTPKNVN